MGKNCPSCVPVHETGLLEAVRQIKVQQINKLEAAREALELSRRTVQTRFDFYDGNIRFSFNPQEKAHLQLLGQSLVCCRMSHQLGLHRQPGGAGAQSQGWFSVHDWSNVRRR